APSADRRARPYLVPIHNVPARSRANDQIETWMSERCGTWSGTSLKPPDSRWAGSHPGRAKSPPSVPAHSVPAGSRNSTLTRLLTGPVPTGTRVNRATPVRVAVAGTRGSKRNTPSLLVAIQQVQSHDSKQSLIAG